MEDMSSAKKSSVNKAAGKKAVVKRKVSDDEEIEFKQQGCKAAAAAKGKTAADGEAKKGPTVDNEAGRNEGGTSEIASKGKKVAVNKTTEVKPPEVDQTEMERMKEITDMEPDDVEIDLSCDESLLEREMEALPKNIRRVVFKNRNAETDLERKQTMERSRLGLFQLAGYNTDRRSEAERNEMNDMRGMYPERINRWEENDCYNDNKENYTVRRRQDIPVRRDNEIGMQGQQWGYRSTARREPAGLPEFKEEVGLDQFLVQFDAAARHYRWTEDEQLYYMKNNIKGAAGKLIWAVNPKSLRELLRVLKTSYGNDTLIERNKVELRSRKRKEGESLPSLFAEIRSLLTDAYPGVHGEVLDDLGKDAFLNALEKRLRNRVRERCPRTMSQALSVAMLLEGVDRSNWMEKEERIQKKHKVCRMEAPVQDNLQELKEAYDTLRADFKSMKADYYNMKQAQETAAPVTKPATKVRFSNAENRNFNRYQNNGRKENEGRRSAFIGKCFNCGQVGHKSVACRQPKKIIPELEPPAKRPTPLHMAKSVGAEIYVKVMIGGKEHQAVLDTGCTKTVLPVRMLPRKAKVREIQEQSLAANNSKIAMTGEFLLEFQLGKTKYEHTVWVSEQVTEFLLGYDWLCKNNCQWDFDKQKLVVNGEEVKLHKKGPVDSSRKVYCARSVELRPGEQKLIPICSKVRHLLDADKEEEWLIEPRPLSNNVLSARTVLPDTNGEIEVLAANFGEKLCIVKEGTYLGDARPSNVRHVLYRLDVESQKKEHEVAVEVRDTDEKQQTAVNGNSHVQCMIDRLPGSLSIEERAAVVDLVHKYAGSFSKDKYDIGFTRAVQHTIDVGNSKPVKQPLRRYPAVHQEFIDKEVEKLLELGLIKPSSAPWASNVVVVNKKDGQLRMCIDYRVVNSKSEMDAFPVPLQSSCLDTLAGSTYFSTIDQRSGYWQIEIAESDRDKTSFVTRSGLWRWKRLPFGLCNAVSLFQRLMDKLLVGLNWYVCLVYLDDIAVFSKTFEQHLVRLELVIQRLYLAGLKLSPEKCFLCQREVHFLGHVISQKGIAPEEEKVKVVKNWPVPTCVKDLRAWIGLIGYYRKWIPKFAHRAKSLFNLMKKDAEFVWTDDCQSAFDDMKQCLVSAPILGLPLSEGLMVVDTDASGTAAGAVLHQEQDGQLRVLAYYSRLFRDAETRYSTNAKELSAVVYALKQFKHYLLGRRFVVRTDHIALKHLLTSKELTALQARHLDFIGQFKGMEIQHRPGINHGNVDGLSRRPADTEATVEQSVNSVYQSTAETEPVTEVKVSPDLELAQKVTTRADSKVKNSSQSQAVVDVVLEKVSEVLNGVDIRKEQLEDAQLNSIIEHLRSNSKPQAGETNAWSTQSKVLLKQWENLQYEDGLLLHRMLLNGRVIVRVVLPTALQSKLTTACHLEVGHQGQAKTAEHLRRRVYFPGWKKCVEEVCRSCLTCQQFKQGVIRSQGKMQLLEVEQPLDRVSIDLTGPHPRSSRGNVYLLTMIDAFSRFLIAVPIPNKFAVTVAKAIHRHLFVKFGLCRVIQSDRGREFQNEILSSICRKYGIRLVQTTAGRPSCNGRVERVHHSLNRLIAKHISDNQKTWDQIIDTMVYEYNCTVHSSTGFSPYELWWGKQPLSPVDLKCTVSSERGAKSANEYKDKLTESLQKLYETARKRSQTAASARKLRYDGRVKSRSFAEGDLVLMLYDRFKPGMSKKWSRQYIGPFLIVKKLNEVNYVVRRRSNGKTSVVHVDRLKPYIAA